MPSSCFFASFFFSKPSVEFDPPASPLLQGPPLQEQAAPPQAPEGYSPLPERLGSGSCGRCRGDSGVPRACRFWPEIRRSASPFRTGGIFSSGGYPSLSSPYIPSGTDGR